MIRQVTRFLGAAFVVALVAVPALRPAESYAQNPQTRLGAVQTSAAYYLHARPGDLTLRVSVLGVVRQPGMYEVPQDTDLAQLLALAGGYVATPENTTRERNTTIRVYRYDGESRVVYESTLADLFNRAEPYPPLLMGDVLRVEVSERPRFTWRDGLSVASGVATLVLVLDRLFASN